ncbi:MAG: TrkA family potassium uptake protein [Cyanobacteriota/Melainabacteria group bacterium]
MTVAFFGSTTILYFLYPLEELPPHHHSFLGVAYDTLLLTFFEQPIPFVDDLRLIPVFFGFAHSRASGHRRRCGQARQSGGSYQFSQEWQKLVAASYQNHVIICGLGNVGKRVAEQLLKFEEEIVCIETREDSKFIAEMTRLRVPVLIADATRASVLEEANIKQAKALMALTDKDLNNLETALTARELNPEIRIVMRMFDQSLADKVKNSLGIECVYSASALAAPVFAQSVVSENLLSSFQFGSTLVNAYQIVIDEDSRFAGMKIDDVRKEYEITVLMHDRQGSVDWNPPTDIILTLGDKLLIVTEADGVKDLLALEKLT